MVVWVDKEGISRGKGFRWDLLLEEGVWEITGLEVKANCRLLGGISKKAFLGEKPSFWRSELKRHLRKCPSPSTYRTDSVYRDGKVHNRACSSLLLRSSCIYLSIIDYTHRECLVWWKYSFAVKKFTYNSPSLLSKIIYLGDKTWKTIIN